MRVPDKLVGHVFEPLWDIYENSVRLKTLRSLRRTQWLSLDELKGLQEKQLQIMMKHVFQSVPYYRELFSGLGIDFNKIKTADDLRVIPILKKSQVRSRMNDLLSMTFDPSILFSGKTGGSTGVSLKYFCDPRCVQIRNGSALRCDEWSGWQLGQPIAAVWGNPPVPLTIKNKIRSIFKDRVIYLDTMDICDESIDRFVQEWEKTKPGMLYGHAHSIFLLAENLNAKRIQLRPSGIVSTSMMLIDQERELIEEVFSVPVTNRYGCEEVSLISCECEIHRGMHLNFENKIVEFLRDDDSPCQPGEDGRIVVTDLTNFGMPMIRYEVGDRGVPSDRKCSCGRGLPLMENITGRVADFLLSQRGSRVAGISLIENTLTRFPGIRQLQFVQERELELQVNLVRGTDYSPEIEGQMATSLNKYLGRDFRFIFNYVDAIPQEESGKYRFSICKV